MKSGIFAVAAIGLFVTACQLPSQGGPEPKEEDIAPPTDPVLIGELRQGSGYLAGYLAPSDLPDSLALLPPPPQEGTKSVQADLEAHEAGQLLRETARWRIAQQDNELHFPEAGRSFSCVLGIEISQESTPHLVTLMRRTLADAGRSTYKAKEAYTRVRPFVTLGDESCVPEAQAMLSSDGSYPSGHAAVGWAWGLLLTGLAPEKADDLLQRGYAFAESRRICGVHWQSDVDAGRLMGAATYARLQSDPVFMAQSVLAKEEIDRASRSTDTPILCD
ncbi:MAG: phosphatase PAP2 family protein [Hyphomonas sp.]|uniref:phosphatase PAP2 family protein n=1 Tax=Hyphomonas sp. TaxID=87 RepID=UPI0034A0A5E9